ncbi:glycoside hydrolase family 10 protein [Flavobacterium algicola]|uniref:glycoside hydrolase family 10 protein n=1 Tax=Flavobacterium algicola TaxID=556529 RepID=UPI001EFD92FF|nr:family 10 glycosylhydrolase [Flavobacterium algicola]MCG9793562.1 family 10 glycosylhydrolase [Flavobacterium algicola]
MTKNVSIVVLFFFLITFFSTLTAQPNPMHPKNEFRAVWIATVVNIDWPKSSLDAVAKQKADYIEILDTYKKLNYNVVIVQVRSVGDAFYPSKFAPWSRYLTGKEGKAPDPYYDPLEWMITQAHQRGFEFHAWFNPFRATFDLKKETLSPNHDMVKHPDWMIKYGDKYYYNPGLPEVQSQLVSVIEEVVRNYDIDAVHLDDYFYPYKIAGQDFNDFTAYRKYGNGLSLADWRRLNTNNYVKCTNYAIKKIKPWVQFGISPFGVWRNKSVDPKGSDTQSGQTNYDDLFADPMAWMEYKWVDYILPQLYWSIDHKTASYSKLLKWWSENSNGNAAVYIGNSSYKINTDSDKKWTNPYEIPNQINLNRSYKNIQGNGFFSAKWFVNNNKAVTKILSENQYKYPALPNVVPGFRFRVADIPTVWDITTDHETADVILKFPEFDTMRYVVVYGLKDNTIIDVSNPANIINKIAITDKKGSVSISLPKVYLEKHNSCAISYIDYYGNESAATLLSTTKNLKMIQNQITADEK